MNFEFRWRQVSEVDEPNIPPEAMYVGLVHYRTLQVRYREGPSGEGWWGDWMNVPMIEER